MFTLDLSILLKVTVGPYPVSGGAYDGPPGTLVHAPAVPGRVVTLRTRPLKTRPIDYQYFIIQTLNKKHTHSGLR